MCDAGVGVEAGARDGDEHGDGGGVGRGCFGCEADYYYSLGHFYELLWTKVRLARFVPTIQLSRETKMRRQQADEEKGRTTWHIQLVLHLLFFSFSHSQLFVSSSSLFFFFLCTTLKMLGCFFYEPSCLLV